MAQTQVEPKTLPWIGVDLDGTLAIYDHWRGPAHIGRPIPKMHARVKEWLAEGKEVRIFTARVWPLAVVWANDQIEQLVGATKREEDAVLAARYIRVWCLQHFGKVLTITCVKDFAMTELWDDRAVQVVCNTGERVDGAGT